MATYVPGVCNIGPEEVKTRMRAGWIGLVVTVLLAGIFAWIHAVPALGLVLFIPAFIAALGFLQAALGFCVAFGMQGLFNVANEAGKTETVSQQEFRAKDQQRAILIILLAIVIGAIVGSLGYLYAMDVAARPSAVPTTQASDAIPGDNLTLGQDSSATLGSYLIGYDGMPVYTYGKDLDGTSHCDAACLGTQWKPYVVTSGNLVAEAPIAGVVGTTTRTDGSVQVTYKNQPLYFFAGDSDDTPTGQGADFTWYVARP